MVFDKKRESALLFSRVCALSLLCVLAYWMPETRAAESLQGQPAPDFALRSLQQQNLRLSEYRGEVVLINFWASWCGECRQAMPGLNDLYDKYRRAGLVMLSINLDDDEHHAMSMAKSLNIAYPVLFDLRKEVGQQYRVEKMPTTVLIDRAGAIRRLFIGYTFGDERKYVAQVRELLDE